MTSVLAVALCTTALAVAAGTASADVSQTPVATSCPTHFSLLSVASLEALGPYLLPHYYDVTTGNNNGYVCGFPLPDAVRAVDCKLGSTVACQLQQLGLPLYRFTDDDNPAGQRALAGG
jgi:hypothetical protein